MNYRLDSRTLIISVVEALNKSGCLHLYLAPNAHYDTQSRIP